MRLKKIRLVGFKSFCDPTEVNLPNNLSAVLGPNGCGKSNVIDAVRWVMGEQSAKHLRGTSMADVIFNGSETRKPLSQASVELVFDNCEGRLGGEFATYSEIAIKRLVTRDGQSDYFLNGSKCRRKDITDIFLGTGLGPRSYAIIGQGTISQIIEAKPDEFRVFLDEAAGISKYKERRRETENRIKHTHENLSRINDIREELGKQLDRLERQSEAAERFQVLKSQERLQKAQLLALRWNELTQSIDVKSQVARQLEVDVEAIYASQSSIDTELEKQHQLQLESNEHFNQIQTQYYSLGAEIARMEESIAHNKERRESLESNCQETQEQFQISQAQFEQDEERISILQASLEELEPELENRDEIAVQLKETQYQIEQQQTQWQEQWDTFNISAAESSQAAHVEQTKIQHIEQSLSTVSQRVERLNHERSLIDMQQIADEVRTLENEISEYELAYDDAHHVLSQSLDDIQYQRDKIKTERDTLNRSQQQLQSLRGRQASLEALQQAALGKQKGATQDWLKAQAIFDNTRLAEHITVASGWEKAVETVLGDYLQAVCVDNLDSLTQAINDFSQGKLNLVLSGRANTPVRDNKLSALTSKITSDLPVVSTLLEGIYTADDLISAYEMVGSLRSHESVVTPDGLWMGPGWLRVSKENDEKAGILGREQELKEIVLTLTQIQETVERCEEALDIAQEELQSIEDLREQKQQALNDINTKIADLKAQLRVKRARIEQLQQRLRDIDLEIQNEQSRNQELHLELSTCREAWQIAMQSMEDNSEQRVQLQSTRDEINRRLDDIRQQVNAQRESQHELQLQVQSKRSELNSLVQSNSRLSQTIEQLTLKLDALKQALQESVAPSDDMDAQLEEKLSRHLELEESLHVARSRLDDIVHLTRELSQQRQQAEQVERQSQQKLEQARMAMQGDLVRRTTLEEQLAETDFTLKQLLEEMPEIANPVDWEHELERIANRIARLGPINLAAIDEFKVESERKTYLDSQYNDLMEALDVLDQAIQKIDEETRHRFKETYDKVNSGFQTLFPKLFGGGKAYLELTGEDMLDTGIAVIARPPGKRNASVHLLSGGEKAMSAIALVFAIFQLNPSPFCMLDEVDAPLDDANVSRFCNLVKEMSKQVQFIFITHNKVTMELADYLAGVTMNEPGVSRIVSVDVEKAISMVES